MPPLHALQSSSLYMPPRTHRHHPDPVMAALRDRPHCQSQTAHHHLSRLHADLPQAVALVLRQVRPTGGMNRRITLLPDTPVSVGRSSRSEAKNLSATGDNALFDCPVISRKHAEIELKINRWASETERITITDTKSMHGTSVNGDKLQCHKPFQLQPGDTIRLGDHISRADSEYTGHPPATACPDTHIGTYDGVTLVVDYIVTASEPQSTTAAKNTHKPGISVPSDSESEFDDVGNDDESVVEETHTSSAHTTPEQKLGGPSKVATVSYPNIIDLEDDDDDDVVETAPPTTTKPVATHTTIPDSYDVSQVDPTPLRDVFFRGLGASTVQPAADESEHEDDVDDEDGSFSKQDQFSDDYLSQQSDDDNSSIAHDDSMHARSLDFEEEGEGDDIDEGPEIMSSKVQPPQKVAPHVGEATTAASTTTRSHYDPVRGFQVYENGNEDNKAPAKSRSYEPTHALSPSFPFMLADSGHSSKWDMGPSGFVTKTLNRENDFRIPYGGGSYPAPYYSPGFPAASPWDEPFALNDSWIDTSAPAALSKPLDLDTTVAPTSDPAEEDENVAGPSFIQSSSNVLGNKRKADDISENDVPTTIDEANKDAQATTVTFNIPTEPAPKKRKIKQSRSNRSFMKTAATEAGKYAAGALVGSVGLVALLVSPLGARLAEC